MKFVEICYIYYYTSFTRKSKVKLKRNILLKIVKTAGHRQNAGKPGFQMKNV